MYAIIGILMGLFSSAGFALLSFGGNVMRKNVPMGLAVIFIGMFVAIIIGCRQPADHSCDPHEFNVGSAMAGYIYTFFTFVLVMTIVLLRY